MTVLHSYETYTNNGWIDVVCVGLIIALLFLIVGTLGALVEKDYGSTVALFILSSAVAIGLIFALDHALEEHTEYEVIIEDFNEVFEQGYEIVDQRGDITIIKEDNE